MGILIQPDHTNALHTQGDEALCYLALTFSCMMEEDDSPELRAGMEEKLNKIYQILGYRASLEYMNRSLEGDD